MSLSAPHGAGAPKSGDNFWIASETAGDLPTPTANDFNFKVLTSEEDVGDAMLDELLAYANEKQGDINIVLLGGRGAQAMYKRISSLIGTDEIDRLLERLNVFTQDALAPMRMANGLSFVRDFERLLGDEFFRRVKSFTPMFTETEDPESSMKEYLATLRRLGGIDIFFLGLGPEADAASHVCYIKPSSGAAYRDIAGIIPISASILEHHIAKFKAGGSAISADDEKECRAATHILTLGPAAILGAKKIVQSIVDASSAPAKVESFERLINTKLSDDPAALEKQLDENPGLWVRLHKNIKTFILPDLLRDQI